MTITKTFTLEADENMIDDIIEELQNNCEYYAQKILEDTDFNYRMEEYLEYKQKLGKEIFNDVVTRLVFDSKAE